MNQIQQILEETFGKKGWQIQTPKEGWEKTSFIATLGRVKYFVKFGVNPKVMMRLSKLRVTPHVISVGKKDHEQYMIQEFVYAPYVPKEWFQHNLGELAAFILRYQSDPTLKDILLTTMTKEFLSIEGEVEAMERQLGSFGNDADIQTGIEELAERYQKLGDVQLVPVHDDPNTKNIFLTGMELLMVDWNKIRLSDSLSDVGALLWWYVPQDRWGSFFEIYGLPMTEELLERIYLGAAKMSMGFTLWHLEKNKDYSAPLADFKAAVNHRQNPRAWYLK